MKSKLEVEQMSAGTLRKYQVKMLRLQSRLQARNGTADSRLVAHIEMIASELAQRI